MSLYTWIFGEPVKPTPDVCNDLLNHDEDVLDRSLLKSAFELMDEKTKKSFYDYGIDSLLDDQDTYNQTQITLLKCKRCGRVRQLVVRSQR
jgi:hypothetical protein